MLVSPDDVNFKASETLIRDLIDIASKNGNFLLNVGPTGEGDIPDGAALFPEIPAELNVHPLLLAVVHSIVFLAGSADEIAQPAAAHVQLDARSFEQP